MAKMNGKDTFVFFMLPLIGVGAGAEVAWVTVQCELGAIVASIYSIVLIAVLIMGLMMYDAGRKDGKGN